MKTKKEKVLEFIQTYSDELQYEEYPKITTRFLAEKLHMQRSNLSSILNQLVKEEKLIKHQGRPVLYQLAVKGEEKGNIFSRLVGYEGSLKNAVNIAKAAVLYPEGNSSILLTGEYGTGLSYFVETVFRFAVASGTLKESFVVLDCKEIAGDFSQYPLGRDGGSRFEKKAQKGLLLIKNIDVLSGSEKGILYAFIHGEEIKDKLNGLPENTWKGIIICSISKEMDEKELKEFQSEMDFHIHLPALRERPLKERFELIRKFLNEEAKRLDRRIAVDASILHSLMLYDCNNNINGLKNDIHIGCANSYARSYKTKDGTISMLSSDFFNYVRKGIIYYRTYKKEIDEIIMANCQYSFNATQMFRNSKVLDQSIYQSIDTRKKELNRQKITEEEINEIISAELQNYFQDYFSQLTERVKDKESLEKIVSYKLLELVENFLKKAEIELQCTFSQKILIGICMHLNGCLIKVSAKQRISNNEISQMVGNYPFFYQLTKDISSEIQKEFKVNLSIDDMIFLMMFLLEGREKSKKGDVAVLIAMHGNAVASAIAEVVNLMADEPNAEFYNLMLEKNIKLAYEELKQKVININKGNGILLIYDMGSVHTMAESIAQETGIEIKCIEMPVTLLGIVSCNRAVQHASLTEIETYLNENFVNMQYFRNEKTKKQFLVVFSSQKERLLAAGKRLEQVFGWNSEEICLLESDDVNYLYNEIDKIMRKGNIKGIIGEEDPGLAQYPFAPIYKLEDRKNKTIEEVFIEKEDGLKETFEYLEEQFPQYDMQVLKTYLLTFIDQLEYMMNLSLDEDKEIGLIVHIVCLIDKLQTQHMPSVNLISSKILVQYEELVQNVKQLLKPIEKAFDVIISDSEIATLISITQKE